MQLKNYSLKIGKRELLKNVSVNFKQGVVSHVLGQNGVGKSVFAKDLMFQNKEVVLISSYSNVPNDITFKELKQLLYKTFEKTKVEEICSVLNTDNINPNLLLKKLSDGQKQKLKLLTYILFDKDIIILDEMTNALDKSTIKEIYSFLNNYISQNVDKVIINITHNLSDLKNVAGEYYLFDEKNLKKMNSMDLVIQQYVGGES